MRIVALVLAAFGVAGCSSSNAAPLGGAIPGADAAHPVVLELFQSQGCSSCPPANANANALADRPDLLILSFSVTYWDHLGWTDRFARPEFTRRQQAYAASRRSDGVYTPQFVLNGRTALVGADRAVLMRAIRAAGPADGGPALASRGGRLDVGAHATAAPAKLLLVTYDPQIRQVPVRAGENSGRTLPHRNIVTAIRPIGDWRGSAVSVALPPNLPNLRRAVLVQQGDGGPILAALKLDR